MVGQWNWFPVPPIVIYWNAQKKKTNHLTFRILDAKLNKKKIHSTNLQTYDCVNRTDIVRHLCLHSVVGRSRIVRVPFNWMMNIDEQSTSGIRYGGADAVSTAKYLSILIPVLGRRFGFGTIWRNNWAGFIRLHRHNVWLSSWWVSFKKSVNRSLSVLMFRFVDWTLFASLTNTSKWFTYKSLRVFISTVVWLVCEITIREYSKEKKFSNQNFLP